MEPFTPFLIALMLLAAMIAAVVMPLWIISRSVRFIGRSFKNTYIKLRHY